jgi:NTE family protein
MLTSNLKTPENIKLCDIFIDHVPNLTYSTGDFEKGNELYEEGKIATKENIDELVALAEKLKGFEQRTHQIPDVKDEIILDTIVYSDISEANRDLVKARTNIQTHKKYSTEDIIAGIDRAMGTNLFKQITYTPLIDEDKMGLELIGLEHSKHQVKGSLHYDTYRGVGLVVNYTGRNVLGQASRLLATVDIAQQPIFGLQYQKNFGDKKMWWWRSDALYEYLKNKVYIRGQVADDMRFKYLQFDNQVNRNIKSLNSYVGIGINYENTTVNPISDPEIVDNVLDLDHYYYNNFEIYAQYIFSDMDKRFYPTRGIHFRAKITRSLWNNLDLLYADDDLAQIKGSTNGFSKLGFDLEKRFHFHNNITGILGANANFIFEDHIKSGEESFTDYGYAAKYFLGGNLLTLSKNSFIFPGLREDELNVSQFMKLNLGVQFMPVNKVYVTPHFNIASVGFGDFDDYIEDAFSPNGDWQDGEGTSSLMSAGLTVSYHSFLGPINFDASWINGIDKVRLFFSLGLFFD